MSRNQGFEPRWRYNIGKWCCRSRVTLHAQYEEGDFASATFETQLSGHGSHGQQGVDTPIAPSDDTTDIEIPSLPTYHM
jgi:hypothetical protein